MPQVKRKLLACSWLLFQVLYYGFFGHSTKADAVQLHVDTVAGKGWIWHCKPGYLISKQTGAPSNKT
jgi:hypothetical protein